MLQNSKTALEIWKMWSWGATAEMEKLTLFDLLHEKIDGKWKKSLRPDLTRALETIWDQCFGHLGPSTSIKKLSSILDFLDLKNRFWKD